MSETNSDDDLGRWGRPLRKRSRHPQPQPGTDGPPAVGPVDHPLPAGGAETIVRSGGALAGADAGNRGRREPEPEDLKLRDLVAYMAQGLVDHPQDVDVVVLGVTRDETAFELRVHPDDLGHVIGKQGRTARSLRLALGAAAARVGRTTRLAIAD